MAPAAPVSTPAVPDRVEQDERSAGEHEAQGVDRAQRAAVDEDRGADPARERAEVRRQRPRHLGLPAGRVAQRDPRDARADERGAQGERAAQRPAARQPRDRPADEWESQVEAHLDVHRPHRRVEHVACRRDEVGDEEQEERQVAQADVARVPGAVQEQERADERDEVAGDDPAWHGGSRSARGAAPGGRRATRRPTGRRGGTRTARRTAPRPSGTRRSRDRRARCGSGRSPACTSTRAGPGSPVRPARAGRPGRVLASRSPAGSCPQRRRANQCVTTGTSASCSANAHRISAMWV